MDAGRISDLRGFGEEEAATPCRVESCFRLCASIFADGLGITFHGFSAYRNAVAQSWVLSTAATPRF